MAGRDGRCGAATCTAAARGRLSAKRKRVEHLRGRAGACAASDAVSKSGSIGAELRDASYATLRGRAVTQAACALVDELSARITARELQTGKRSYNRHGQRQQAFRDAVAAFAADLLIAQMPSSPSVWVHRSMDAAAFTGAPPELSRCTQRSAWLARIGTDQGTRQHRPLER